MMFSILELVTCFKAGGPRLGLTMSQGATRKKSLGTTAVEDPQTSTNPSFSYSSLLGTDEETQDESPLIPLVRGTIDGSLGLSQAGLIIS